MRKGNGKPEGHIDLRNQDLRNQDLRNQDLRNQDLRDRDSEHEDSERGPQVVPGAGGTISTAGSVTEISAASEVEKLKAERDALLDRLARLQAEFDNARKRAVKEQQDFREFAAADVIKNILPILDSFERALKANADPTDFRNGVELIYRQFQDALLKIGVQSIVAAGQRFDPRLHEAVEMVDTVDVPDHHVLDELQRGYRYKDRLLRPAMVRVARNSQG